MKEFGESPDDLAALRKALRIFSDMRLSPERTVVHLLKAGISPELIRTQFPELSDQHFAPVATDAKLRAALYAKPPATGPQRRAPLPPSAQALTQRVLTKISAPAPTSTTTAPAREILPPAGRGSFGRRVLPVRAADSVFFSARGSGRTNQFYAPQRLA